MKTLEERYSWRIALTICKDADYKRLADYLKAKWATYRIGQVIFDALPKDDVNELIILMEAVKHMNDSPVAKKEAFTRLKKYGIV